MDVTEYDFVVNRLRDFFRSLHYIEVPTQSRLSILAACEDPATVASFTYDGVVWPLPQTGQMWLEHELLANPAAHGFYCVSTSYRQEPHPIPGRHEKIFPMFEFETNGNMNKLELLEKQLLEWLGFKDTIISLNYETASRRYNVPILHAQHEEQIDRDYGHVVLLKNFPERTSPFWNMRRKNGTARKIDVLLHGMETIGSAERSFTKEEMYERFYTISDGEYARTLFNKFGKKE